MQKKIRRSALATAVAVSCLLTAAWGTAAVGAVAETPSSPMDRTLADSATVVEIRSTGVDLTYDRTEIRARAGEKLTIRYTNGSDDMMHNVVVVRTEDDIRPVGLAALKAHASEYIPEAEKDRIIAFSKLATPGETVEFTFVVPPAGSYPFICTYSGHFTMMQGRLISTD